MNRFALLFSILLLFTTSSTALAQGAEADLNQPHQFTVGDYAALILPELLKIREDFDAPTIVTYEPDENVIDVEIFGVRDQVEGARETIQNFWNFIEQFHVPYVARRFDTRLTEDNFRLLYYDRTGRNGTTMILQKVRGQFLLPSQ